MTRAGEHGVVVDADLEGSGWKTSPTGWFLFSLTGPTAAGGAIADVDLDGSALRNQTGSTGVTRADLQLFPA